MKWSIKLMVVKVSANCFGTARIEVSGVLT